MAILETLLVISLIATVTANTLSLTEGQTCGQAGNIASVTYSGRTYVCSDECPRPYLTNNGTAVNNGTSLLESSFRLGEFPCVPSSPLISQPGNIGCYLVLRNDDVTPVTAWSFHIELTNENGVLLSTAYGDVILSNLRVQVRSPNGNNEADIGQVLSLNQQTHFVIMMRKSLRDVFVDVYINGEHSGSTTSYPAPFNVGSMFDVSFGGCDVCGSSIQRSLVGRIEDIRKFDSLTDREARALYNGTLPEVTPASSCLCSASHPFVITSSNGASYACSQTKQPGQAPGLNSNLISRFYNQTTGAYYSDISFLTDGMTSAFAENFELLPAFWLSESGPVTFTVQFSTQPSIIRNIRIYMLSDLPDDSIQIYKETPSVLLHVVGDCSKLSSQGIPYKADDVTCTDARNILPGSTLIEWKALDRPGVNSTVMTSSARRHLTANGITIQLKGGPRSGQAQHAVSEIIVDARPHNDSLCQCYMQKTKSCECSCKGNNQPKDAVEACEPRVMDIYPEIGATKGGSRLTIMGKNLLPKVTEVTVGGRPCTIQTSEEEKVVCQIPSMNSTMSDQPVKITLENGFFYYTPQRFSYINFPTITAINPSSLFETASTIVTVTGTNLGTEGAHFAVQKVQNGQYKTASSSPCISQTDTEVVCPTPEINMTGYTTNNKGLYNNGSDFVMGLVWPYVKGLDSLKAAAAAGQKVFQPRIFAGPMIEFKDGTAVFRAYKTDEFIFEGKNLLSDMISKNDYSVRVGGYDMEVLEVTDTTLTCKLPKEKPEVEDPRLERNTLLFAEVVAGSTTLQPGYIKWFNSIWDDVSARIGILCAVFAVFMVLLVIALTILARIRKRKAKEEASLLNNNYNSAEAAPLPSKSQIEDFGPVVSAPKEKLINLVDTEYLAKLKMCIVTDSNSLTRSGAHVKGNFGEIIHGEYNMTYSDNKLVYIKVIRDVSRNAKKYDVESHVARVDGYLRDAGVLADLTHPNVHPILGLAFSGSQAFFLYPRCKSTDLKFYLRHPDVNCTVATLLGHINDLAKGMKYIHTQDIIHGDVAARNCVVDDNNSVCISDAVLADDFYPEDYSQPLGGTANKAYPIRWMSPRYLTSGACNYFGDDIYAFGITMWEIITRCQFPYADMTNKAVLTEVPDGMRPEQPHHCPDEVFDVMSSCWSPNFKLRPSFEYIVNTLATIGNPYNSPAEEVIELTARSPPEAFQQEVLAPHVTLSNSGGAYFNIAFKNDRDATTNM